MKRKLLALFCAAAMTSAMLAGCGSSEAPVKSAASETSQAAAVESSAASSAAEAVSEAETAETKTEVVVTMPKTSEPESGFDPAYGWGAGEHVHEPLI